MKITIEISPIGHEIRNPIEGKDPEDWPVIGWSEGLRAILADTTNSEQIMRRVLQVEGLDDAAFQKLLSAIKVELDGRFRSQHKDRICKDFESRYESLKDAVITAIGVQEILSKPLP